MKKLNFSVIFGNGGGITLQTTKYCHYYDDASRVAEDVKAIIADNSTEGWDGNEAKSRLEYDSEEEANGGYSWYSRRYIENTIKAGSIKSSWRNVRDFFEAMGIEID